MGGVRCSNMLDNTHNLSSPVNIHSSLNCVVSDLVHSVEWNCNGENIPKKSSFKFLTWDSPIAQKHGSIYPTYQKIWKMDQISETCSTCRNATSGRCSLICGQIIVKGNCLSPRFLTKLLQVTNVLQSLLLNKKNSFLSTVPLVFVR